MPHQGTQLSPSRWRGYGGGAVPAAKAQLFTKRWHLAPPSGLSHFLPASPQAHPHPKGKPSQGSVPLSLFFLFVCIPFYQNTTFCLSIHLLWAYLSGFQFGTIMNETATNIVYSFCVDLCFRFSWASIQEQSSYVLRQTCAHFSRDWQAVFQPGGTISFHLLPGPPHPCQHLVLPVFFIVAMLLDVSGYFFVCLNLHLPDD